MKNFIKIALLNIGLLVSAGCISSFMVHLSVAVFYDLVLATIFWICFGFLIQVNAFALIILTIYFVRSIIASKKGSADIPDVKVHIISRFKGIKKK